MLVAAMSTPRSLRRCVAGAALVLALAPGAAMAEVRSGEGSDPSGDQAASGRDLVGLRASYDTAGAVEATLTLRGEPSAASDGFISVAFGTLQAGGSCGAPRALLVGYLDPADTQAGWALDSAPSSLLAATKATSGAAITLRGSGAGLASRGFTCASASIEIRGSGSTVYDELGTPIALTAAAAPTPSPSPSPAATPLPTATPTPTPAPAAAPAPQVSLVIVEEPPAVARGRTTKVRLGIANTTKRRTLPLTLSVKLPRGVEVVPRTVALGRLRPGATKTVMLRLRPGRRAAASSRVRFSLRAGQRVLARQATQLRLAVTTGPTPTPTPAPTLPGTAGQSQSDLSGAFYSRFTHELRATPGGFDYVAVTEGYVFVSAQFVFKGLPRGGLPTCSERTTTCLPYTYDAASGALTIDGKPATLSADSGRSQLTVAGKSLSRNVIPAPGTRFSLSLKNITSSLFPYNAVTSTYLQMTADGRFAFSSATAITPNPGGGAVGITGPPNRRGSYEVLDRARLRLTFDDGTSREHTISQFGPDAAKDGLLIDASKYWLPS